MSEPKIRWVSHPEVYKHDQNNFSFIFKETTLLQYLSCSRISILECELCVSITYVHVPCCEKVLLSVTKLVNAVLTEKPSSVKEIFGNSK
jgi:hypothetical protein